MTPGDVLEANSWIPGCDSEIIDLEHSYCTTYPNPFKDVMAVDFKEKGTWIIYSPSGVVLDMGEAKFGETVKIGRKLNSGFYILEFSPKFVQGSFSKRIVKL